MQQKNTRIWLILLIIPIPLLVLNAIIQVIARAANNGQGNIIMNILSLVMGVIAVLLLLGSPLWLYMYVHTKNMNKAAAPGLANEPPTNGTVTPQ